MPSVLLLLLRNLCIVGILLGVHQTQALRERRRRSFAEGEPVPLYVNSLTSAKTLVPLDHYDAAPFCRPRVGVYSRSDLNLGERLQGYHMHNSPYQLRMKQDAYCEKLCVRNLGSSNHNQIAELVQNGYHVNWLVDGLPAASVVRDVVHQHFHGEAIRFFGGIPIGYMDHRNNDSGGKKPVLYNHVNIEIRYHRQNSDNKHPTKRKGNMYNIVRVHVRPMSIRHELSANGDIINPIPSCDSNNNSTSSTRPQQHTTYEMVADHPQQFASGNNVLFTYDVIWTEDPANTWATRWDIYFSTTYAVPRVVHWMSLANSLITCIVLAAILAAGLCCYLRKERDQYNSLATADNDEEEEESFRLVQSRGWIAIRGDVFRPPTCSPTLFAVLCGTGAQLFATCSIVVVFASLGCFMTPAEPGSLVRGVLLTFAFMGVVSGYVSARLAKTFQLDSWRRVTALAGLGFPGILFGVFFMINMVERAQGSTKAVPVTTFLILLVLLFCVLMPLVRLGAYLGFERSSAIEFPFEPNHGEFRPLPEPRPLLARVAIVLLRFFLLDILPFATIFVELYYILGCVWMGFYYSTYGFLVLAVMVGVITCGFTSVVVTYFRFRREDYRWWWSSLTTGGAMGVYVLLYSIVYFFRQLPAQGAVAGTVYFGYMLLVSLGLACMFGSVGVYASLVFAKRMYASLRHRENGPNRIVDDEEEDNNSTSAEEDGNGLQMTGEADRSIPGHTVELV